MDLDKLNKVKLVMEVWFRLKRIFDTAPGASKNTACLKYGQKWPKNIILLLLPKLSLILRNSL